MVGLKVKITYPEEFLPGRIVNFYIIDSLDNKVIVHHIGVISKQTPFFISFKGFCNSVIFDRLNIDVSKFCEELLGIPKVGAWPEVPKLSMLKETLKLLEHYEEF